MRRRDFVRRAAALVAANALTRPLAGAERLPGLPGIQLYTLRSLMAQDLEATLAAVAGIGYREVEFAGYFGRPPGEIRRSLAATGLSAPSAHVDFPLEGPEWQQTMDEALAAGHRFVILAWLPPERRAPLDAWRRLADQLNQAGEAARRQGLEMGYHNHDFEFQPLEGRLPYDLLLERTDPALVTFELDLYWISRAGHDPLAYFQKARGRFRQVHVKDMAAGAGREMVDPGDGVLDFPTLLAAAATAGVRHFFVEHDEPRDPLGTARAGYTALHRILG
jgi:sugar phosphate isomerase/epimerase